jgi:hypothetical protein
MAGTSVLKLKVDDKEYNASLKQAQQGMQHLEQALKDAGKSFTQVDKSVVDYVRGIGQMEAQSKTARGRISEMSSAFIELSLQYKNMSDEVKSSDVGKALAESMEQLKNRTIDAKEELDELSKSLNNTNVQDAGGGLISGLTGMMQVFGGNLLAQGVATLTSELTGSVQESLKLAREGEGIRIAFERLNQPGLLDNLKEATHGTVSELDLMKQAIKFDNFKLPLEDLSTYLAFAQQKAKDTGESIDYLVDSIVTGLGRQSKQILDNLGISAAELTKRMNEGADMTTAVADIIREEMAKAGDYVETAADRAARATAKAKDEMEAMGRTALPIADEVSEMWNTIRNGGITLINTVLTPIANSLKGIQNILRGGASFDVRIPDNVGSNIDDNGNFIKKPSNGNWAGFNAQTGQYNDAITSIADVVVTGNAPTKKSGRGGGGRSTKTGPTMEGFQKDMSKWQSADLLKPEIGENFVSVWAQMDDEGKKHMLSLNEAVEDLGDSLAKLGEKEVTGNIAKQMKKTTDAAKAQQMAMNLAAQAVSSFGSAMAGLDDPSAKAAGTVLQAIASIALGFAVASSQSNTAGTGWGWLAWVAAGMAAMATTISTIHSLTGYAEGGMIKGNSYSGDNIGGLVDGSQFVGLNAGEVVLNAAQQNTLAQNLEGAGLQNLRLEGVISGEKIHIVHNRYLKRSGQGELVTW